MFDFYFRDLHILKKSDGQLAEDVLRRIDTFSQPFLESMKYYATEKGCFCFRFESIILEISLRPISNK